MKEKANSSKLSTNCCIHWRWEAELKLKSNRRSRVSLLLIESKGVDELLGVVDELLHSMSEEKRRLSTSDSNNSPTGLEGVVVPLEAFDHMKRRQLKRSC